MVSFGQLNNYNVRNIFLEESCRDDTGRLPPDFFLIFEKALFELKVKCQHLGVNIFW